MQVYVDKAFQEEVEQLPVKCSYHDRGCKWQSTLVNLTPCTTYYIAVKAYNLGGESPEFSNEVQGWARPSVGSVGDSPFGFRRSSLSS